MLLTDRDIRHGIEMGDVGLWPYDPALVQPSSVDVRLGNEFQVLREWSWGRDGYMDPTEDNAAKYEPATVALGEALLLRPGMFALGSTVETLHLPLNLAARLEGKSSLGRLGLLCHATAGFIDPGFRGTVTLELANLTQHPIRLWPGMRVGQLCFFKMTGNVQNGYGTAEVGSHYQNQSGPTLPRPQEVPA